MNRGRKEMENFSNITKELKDEVEIIEEVDGLKVEDVVDGGGEQKQTNMPKNDAAINKRNSQRKTKKKNAVVKTTPNEEKIDPNQCRICLSKKNLTKIFNFDKTSTPRVVCDKIMQLCSTVKITEKDNLPQMICCVCVDNLKVAYEFKILCERTDQEMRKKLRRINNKIHHPTNHNLIDSDESNTEDNFKNTDDDEFHISDIMTETGDSCDSNYSVSKKKRTSKTRKRSTVAASSSSSRKRNSNTSRNRSKRSTLNAATTTTPTSSSNQPLSINLGKRSLRSTLNTTTTTPTSSSNQPLSINLGKRSRPLEVTATPTSSSNQPLSINLGKRSLEVVLIKTVESSDEKRSTSNAATTTTTTPTPTSSSSNQPLSINLGKRSLEVVLIKSVESSDDDISLQQYKNKANDNKNKQQQTITVSDDEIPAKKNVERKNHHCTICEKIFNTPNALKEHHKSHTKSLTCHICDQKFKLAANLIIHIQKHKQKHDDELTCGKCHKVLSCKQVLKRHLQNIHNCTESMNYSCDRCKKNFTSLAMIDKHRKTTKCAIYDPLGECDLNLFEYVAPMTTTYWSDSSSE